jgi:AcrR family transcriptional regulator
MEQQGQTTPRRRLGGRSARVRAAVFAATMQVLQERGYELTSVAEIAGRAGVHETSIYRRWGTKEALLMEAALKQTEEAIRVPDTGALRSDLVQFLEEMRTFFQSPLGVALMQLLVSAAGHAELTDARRTFYSRRFALVRVLFERAVQRGEIRASVNFQLLTETLIGPLYVRQLLTGEPLSRDLPEQIVELILHGVEVAP